MRSDRRAAEQTHLAFAYPGPRLGRSRPRPRCALFAQAVGGGMSSRLFQELREDRGLAYSIYAWTQGFAETGLFGVNLSTDKARAAEAHGAGRATASNAPPRTSTEAELKRARAQVEAGLLMTLETPQGRADSIARSIEIFGRIMSLDEMLAELRARRRRRRARARGRRCSSGPRASAAIGGKIALRAPMSLADLKTIVAEPWADWGLIDSGHGRKWERYGDVTVVRPEPQAMWAPALDDWAPDATFVPGSDEEGGGRWVQHRAGAAQAGRWRAATSASTPA